MAMSIESRNSRGDDEVKDATALGTGIARVVGPVRGPCAICHRQQKYEHEELTPVRVQHGNQSGATLGAARRFAVMAVPTRPDSTSDSVDDCAVRVDGSKTENVNMPVKVKKTYSSRNSRPPF